MLATFDKLNQKPKIKGTTRLDQVVVSRGKIWSKDAE